MLLTSLAGFGSGCGPDLDTIEGALAGAAAAVGNRDYEALFRVLDARARTALASIYRARKQAADVIRASYPPDAQRAALAELGDAIQAESAVDLFRRRCAESCMQTFADALGAPREVRTDGPVRTVKTVRGTELPLYRAEDGEYGLMWDTPALLRERARAAAELDLVQKNGELYREQRALEQARN